MSAIESIDELRARLDSERVAGRSIALVPTMGALHDGHLALVKRAHELADVVVVSIFVNPLQFGPSEDLDSYPRSLDSDLAILSRGSFGSEREIFHPRSAETPAPGVDVEREGEVQGESSASGTVVFAPSAAEMYPDGEPQTTIAAGAVAGLFEGATRPSHFDGMLTVVAKLFNIVHPSVAVFGHKDAQQVFLVRRMIADLNLPITLDTVDTVREASGLALSSRNRHLSEDDHSAALVLSAALEAAAASAAQGADFARVAGRNLIAEEPKAELDYFELVDPATFLPVEPDFRGDAIAIIAARVGSTRLIDNRAIRLP